MNMPTVRTPYGLLRGTATAHGLAFLGIRYARARRWRAPLAIRRADSEVDASRFGPSPPQIPSPATAWRPAFSPRAMSEDCLNLNVWTPATDGARRPVLVHVFGGGFETGSASEGPQDGAALSAQSGAVVVRVNFRIGALGFLHLADAFGDDYVAGNLGVQDLISALQWVNENIGALGGDPDNVTLFGLSSGAFMIASLFAMPASRGLFAKAWMQSGSASRVLTRAQGADVAAEFLSEVGVARRDGAALERLPIDAILAAQRKVAALDLGDRNAPGGRTLGIVEDGASLPEHPLRAFQRGDRRDVPVVLGHTRDEARLWFAAGVMRIPESFADVEAEVVRFAGAENGADLFAFYRERFPQADPAALREKFLGDAVYVLPAIRTAQAHENAAGAAHLYRFDWTPPGENAILGAAHGLDETFVWNVADAARSPIASGDAGASTLGAAMSGALIGFARSGNPGWGAIGERPAMRVFGDPAIHSCEIDTALLEAWRGVDRR
jgi:para-nitrobenzyl esterase